jgi:predicted phage terminase large subunit-like protein
MRRDLRHIGPECAAFLRLFGGRVSCPLPHTTNSMTITTAHALSRLPTDARRGVLDGLTEQELSALEYEWPFWARPDQLPPPGDWRTWLLLAGRGAGKTRAAAEFIREAVESGRHANIGVVGPTADAIRRDMVEGPSGLLAIAPPWHRPEYEPSVRRIKWPGGQIAYLLSAEEPDRMRGSNLDLAWADELGSWQNQQQAWDTLMMALRIPGPGGDAPRVVISTTPKPSALLKAIMLSPTTVVTRARTADNAANLDASTIAYLHDKYGGTRLGRQELDGELLEDAEGALWSRKLIEECRIRRSEAPDNLQRIVIAVDPPGGSSRSNAECGIIVAGLGRDRHGYVLADISGHYSPEEWASRAVSAYIGHRADRIVAEANFGGQMVEATIRSVDANVPIRMVTASRGKQVRAEPVASWFEQHRVHLVGEFPQLEDQLTSWDPSESGPSPDRLDSMVWALTDLMGGPPPMQIDPKVVEQIRERGLFRRHV